MEERFRACTRTWRKRRTQSALTHARFAEKWRAARGKQHPMYQTTAVATAAKATVVDGVRFSRSGEFTKV